MNTLEYQNAGIRGAYPNMCSHGGAAFRFLGPVGLVKDVGMTTATVSTVQRPYTISGTVGKGQNTTENRKKIEENGRIWEI